MGVWSDSAARWLTGYIEGPVQTDGYIEVRFSVDGRLCRKFLRPGSQNLRSLEEADPGTVAAAVAGGVGTALSGASNAKGLLCRRHLLPDPALKELAGGHTLVKQNDP